MSKTLDNVRILNVAKVQGTTQSTSASTGALIVDGGIGIAKNLNVDGNINDITPTEFGYLDGVTSNIQTQLNGKASTSHTHAASDVTSGTFADARIAASNVTQHEASITIGNLSGAPTGAVVGTSDTQTLSNKTFSDAVNIDDTTQSSSVSTGALIVDGGVGIAKNINVGGTSNLIGQVTLGTGGTAYSFPTTVGSTGQVLEVNGSGDLQFADNSGGGTSAPSITLAACPMVAVGSGTNTIANSEDGGLTWNGLGATVFSSSGRAIAFNGTDLYVAGGEGTNTLAFSSDGETFIGLGTGVFNTACHAIAYSDVLSRWVAAGNGTNTLAYSDDGITWIGLGTSIFTANGLGVAYNGVDRFVAVGNGTNTIAYSSDGISWSATTNGNSIISSVGRGVAYVTSATRWVALGEGTNTIAYSDDNGDNWTGVGTSTFSTRGYMVAYNGFSRLVAVGEGTNSIAYSDDDGANWTGVGTSIFTSYGLGIVYNAIDARWSAGGQGTNTQAYSTDGISWTGLGTTIFATYSNAITSCDRLPQSTPVFPIVAFGKDTTSGASNIVYSDDGGITTYTNIDSANTFDFSVQGFGGASNGAHFWVGCGQDPDNTLAYSYNGIVWFGAGASVFNARARAVAVNTGTGRWVAAGEGTTNTLAYSDNGTTWTGLAKTVFDVAGLGVAYDGGINSRWVAVGIGNTNTIAYSDDQGLTWTGVGKSIFSVAGRAVAHNGNDLWVAVGEGTNTVAYSSDGISWTGVSVFTVRGNCIAYSADDFRFVAGGQGTNTMYYSTFATSWVATNNVFTTSCDGIAYDDKTSNWVATGRGTNHLAHSSTGSVWTGIGINNFTSNGGNGLVTFTNLPPPPFGGASPLFIATTGNTGTNAYITSGDAITWTGRTLNAGAGNDTFTDFAYKPVSNRWVGVGGTRIYYSDDNAETWIEASTISSLQKIVYLPTPDYFIAIRGGGNTAVYRSTDSGETWAFLSNAPINVYNMVYCKNTGNLVVSGTNGAAGLTAYSTNNGSTWTTVNPSSVLTNIDYLYSTNYLGTDYLFFDDIQRFGLSSNGGVSWGYIPEDSNNTDAVRNSLVNSDTGTIIHGSANVQSLQIIDRVTRRTSVTNPVEPSSIYTGEVLFSTGRDGGVFKDCIAYNKVLGRWVLIGQDKDGGGGTFRSKYATSDDDGITWDYQGLWPHGNSVTRVYSNNESHPL